MSFFGPAPKVGIALGSGGARGWSHIGVLEVLEEAGVKISCVAGTSMGSLVGAIYAGGGLSTLRDLAEDFDWKQVLYYFSDVTFPRSGLIDGSKLAIFLSEHISIADISKLNIPFAAVATDVYTGKPYTFTQGNVLTAVRSSVSVPGMFTPISHGSRLLVDGGLVDPVPVRAARELGAEFVIAVDLNQGRVARSKPGPHEHENQENASSSVDALRKRIIEPMKKRVAGLSIATVPAVKKWLHSESEFLPSIFDVLGDSLRIMEAQISAVRLNIDKPDLVLEPEVGQLNMMDFAQAALAIEEGRIATRALLEQHKKLLKKKRILPD